MVYKSDSFVCPWCGLLLPLLLLIARQWVTCTAFPADRKQLPRSVNT
jgi:hypothetical protein